MSKRSLLLALWCLCVFSARAQITQNGPLTQAAEAPAGTTEAWWEHVKSLRKKGMTGTSGQLIPLSEIDVKPFAGKQPRKTGESDVIFSSGKHTFYDLDLTGLVVEVKGTAQVSFYNCRFGQPPGIGATFAPLVANGDQARLKLRFCDFVGPATGNSTGAMLSGKAIQQGSSNRWDAAYIDIAYCRTWGQANDGWKIARGKSSFSYFGPTVGSARLPTVYQEGKSYQKGDYVVQDIKKRLFTSHVWKLVKDKASGPPAFDEKDTKKTTNGWRYFNPHADFFHIFASRYRVTAEGHYIHSTLQDPRESDRQGAALPGEATRSGAVQIGMNNAVRYDNGDEDRVFTQPPVLRGFYIRRDADRDSKAFDTGIGWQEPPNGDRGYWRMEHLRTDAPSQNVVNTKNLRFNFALENARTLDGSSRVPINNNQFSEEYKASSEDYVNRNPTEAPTLEAANRWNVTPINFKPTFNDNGQRVNAVVFLARGKRLFLVEQANGNISTYDNGKYRFSDKKADGTYDIYSDDGTDFHLVKWRGKADWEPAESSASANNARVANAAGEQDFDVMVISPFGQSQLSQSFGSAPSFLDLTGPGSEDMPRVRLDAENVTVILGRSTSSTFTGPRTGKAEVIRPKKADAKKINNGVIAAANAFNRMFPGKHLIIAPQTKSGTGMSVWMDADQTDGGKNKRTWSESTEIRELLENELATRHEGSKIAKIAGMCWWGDEAKQLTDLVNTHMVRFTGLKPNGKNATPNNTIKYSLWDLKGNGFDPLFDETWKLALCLPGGRAGSADVGNGKDMLNYGWAEDGTGPKGRTKLFSLERAQSKGEGSVDNKSLHESMQEFLDHPNIQEIRTNRPVAGPIIAAMKDFAGGDRGEGETHPAQYSRYGQALLGSQVIVEMILAAYGADAHILGHETLEGGKKTLIRVGLPQGEELSTLAKVKKTSDDSRFTRTSGQPHLQEDGTGFMLRRSGDSWKDARAITKTGQGPPRYQGAVKITNPGTGTGSARYGEVTITWAQPIEAGDKLSYLPYGEFDGELGPQDIQRFPNQHFLIAHHPDWDNGTEFGFPGHPVTAQTGAKNLADGEMILKPDKGYIGDENNGGTGAVRVSGGSIVDGGPGGGGDGSSAGGLKITGRSPALDSSAHSGTNISVSWDRPVTLAKGVIKIVRTDTNEELARYDPTGEGPEVSLNNNRVKLFVKPDIDLPKGAPIEVRASLSAIVPDDGTPMSEANKLLAKFTVRSGGGNARTAVGGATDMVLYPNPSEGSFTLVLPETDKAGQVSVLDLSGKVVYQAPTDGKRALSIATTLPMGSYLVKVVGVNASYVERLVVE